MRENPDIGRPKQVQLIFDRPIIKTTPGLFRTWVITDGLTPSLHIDYKGTRIKQHHKEGWALRTDTTINNTYIFYIGKNLRNLPALRRIGFQVNLQLLQVQRISHDCILAEEAFQKNQSSAAGGIPMRLRASPILKHKPFSAPPLFFQLLPHGFSTSAGSSDVFPKLTAIALPISACEPSGSAPEPAAAYSAPDSKRYSPSFPHPTSRFGAASIDLIRRSYRGSNIQN